MDEARSAAPRQREPAQWPAEEGRNARARNVTKTVAAPDAHRDVSLTLAHGSLNVLLGPTLSGKTSLMRLMAGLDAPTAGSVWFDGKDVTGVPVQRALGRHGLPAVHQLSRT